MILHPAQEHEGQHDEGSSADRFKVRLRADRHKPHELLFAGVVHEPGGLVLELT